MPRGNVGNITARANVSHCTCTREGFCSCDNFQTNEIGVRRTDMECECGNTQSSQS